VRCCHYQGASWLHGGRCELACCTHSPTCMLPSSWLAVMQSPHPGPYTTVSMSQPAVAGHELFRTELAVGSTESNGGACGQHAFDKRDVTLAIASCMQPYCMQHSLISNACTRPVANSRVARHTSRALTLRCSVCFASLLHDVACSSPRAPDGYWRNHSSSPFFSSLRPCSSH
jgi:hypothetical protein